MARFGRRRGGDQPEAPAPRPTEANPTPPVTGSNPLVVEPEPSLNERLEGQRSWLAQLDRRVGVRTYAGAAALVIALAAAAVALVLVLQLQDDAATKADVDQLRKEIAAVENSATEAAEDDVQGLTERITELETEISGFGSEQDSTDQQISVVEDDIQDLRDQISELDEASSSSSSSNSNDTGSVDSP